MYDFIYDVTKSIKISSSESVFDRWLKNEPNSENTAPKISPYLGSGSDHMAFLQRAGVPCIDQAFIRDKVICFLSNLKEFTRPLVIHYFSKIE